MVAAVPRFHVTVLSNFARGFDKYACTYSKLGIPESTYPDRFFPLPPDSLSIGVDKARPLLEKLGLPGNRLIALESHVADHLLNPNTRTGLGEFIESHTIRVDGLHDVKCVDGQWQLAPLMFEEAIAASLNLIKSDFVPFSRLQPRSFSVLPIAKGCQAACPFCFSDASASAEQEQAKIDFDKVSDFARTARVHGAERFVITGGGEPGLVPHAKLLKLIATGAEELGKAVLITNAHHLTKVDPARRKQALRDYHTSGLKVLAVSRHHHDDATNTALMNLSTPAADIASTWREGRDEWPGLRLRLTCVLQRGGIQDLASLSRYIAWAAELGIDEICFKELYVSTSIESVYHQHAANIWSRQHQIPLSLVLDYAGENDFTEVHRLPWGAPVFRGLSTGRPIQIAAYTEPSLFWERTQEIARSWNLMADGRCLVSLEDRDSEISLEDVK